MTYQIVRTRYSNGAVLEDTWPVLYATPEEAAASFDPDRMFEDPDDPEADHFIRELDDDYRGTGRTLELN